MVDGNVTIDRSSEQQGSFRVQMLPASFTEANFVDGESRAIERVGRRGRDRGFEEDSREGFRGTEGRK